MASVSGIAKRLRENDIEEKLIEEIIGDSDIVNIIQRMDELLEFNVKCHVLDACACCTKSTKQDKMCREYGRAMADKPLEEKMKGLADINFGCVTLNADKTLTISFCWIIDGKKFCSCGYTRGISMAGRPSKNKNDANQNRIIPLSYCLCCAGNFRDHLQNALCVKLKTKEIVSSPINSKGEKPCEFMLEIIE